MSTIPKTIALVDWLHMLTVQVKVAANDKDLSDSNRAGRRALAQLNAVRSSVGQDGHVIVCMDSPPYWRKKLCPEYKGTRSDREPEFASILEWTLGAIVEDGFHIARAPGEEADDVMATLARVYTTEFGFTDVRLVGADKDGLQCVSEHVRLFVPKERGEFDIRGPEWLLKEYGVGPSDFALLLAIMGDKSDNIGGIEGIGKGHGAKLITTYKDMAGMARGLVAATEAASKPGAKPLAAVWKHYAAGMAKLPLWLQLTTLNTSAKLEFSPDQYLVPIERVVSGELYDDSFDPPSLEELEAEAEMMRQERAAMAATLPVGEPPRDPAERRAAMAAEADRVLPMPPMHSTGEPGKLSGTFVAPEQPGTYQHDPSKMVIGTDPKASATLRELAANNVIVPKAGSVSAATAPFPSAPASQPQKTADSAPAPSPAGNASSPPAATPPAAATQVVPSERGPRKPKVSDEIEQNALAVQVDAPTWQLAAQPNTAKELLQIAEVVFKSPLFRTFGSPHGTFAIMSFGRELGLGYMQSLMAFCEVKGKPFMWAHWMRGHVLRDPRCEYLINTECTEEASTWITRRRGWPEGVQASYRFTFAEAEAIGLTTGPNAHNWKTNKRSMVDKTASSRLLRQVYADIIGGMHAPEEDHGT